MWRGRAPRLQCTGTRRRIWPCAVAGGVGAAYDLPPLWLSSCRLPLHWMVSQPATVSLPLALTNLSPFLSRRLPESSSRFVQNRTKDRQLPVGTPE
jgi:hypothetical protein